MVRTRFATQMCKACNACKACTKGIYWYCSVLACFGFTPPHTRPLTSLFAHDCQSCLGGSSGEPGFAQKRTKQLGHAPWAMNPMFLSSVSSVCFGTWDNWKSTLNHSISIPEKHAPAVAASAAALAADLAWSNAERRLWQLTGTRHWWQIFLHPRLIPHDLHSVNRHGLQLLPLSRIYGQAPCRHAEMRDDCIKTKKDRPVCHHGMNWAVSTALVVPRISAMEPAAPARISAKRAACFQSLSI